MDALAWDAERYNVYAHEDQKGIYILLIVHNSSLVDLTNQIIHSGPSGTFRLDAYALDLIVCVVGTILNEQKVSYASTDNRRS